MTKVMLEAELREAMAVEWLIVKRLMETEAGMELPSNVEKFGKLAFESGYASGANYGFKVAIQLKATP